MHLEEKKVMCSRAKKAAIREIAEALSILTSSNDAQSPTRARVALENAISSLYQLDARMQLPVDAVTFRLGEPRPAFQRD